MKLLRLCPLVAIVASIVIGVITTALTFMATITVTPAFLWVLFGIAVVYLILSPILVRSSNTRGCARSSVPALLTGLLGTILTSVILLGITFAATSFLGALITGALLGFFTLIVTSTACITKCAAYDCE